MGGFARRMKSVTHNEKELRPIRGHYLKTKGRLFIFFPGEPKKTGLNMFNRLHNNNRNIMALNGHAVIFVKDFANNRNLKVPVINSRVFW